MLYELREINQSFGQFSDILLKSEKISKIKDNTNFVKSFEELSKKLNDVYQKLDKLDFTKLPKPNVIIPKNLEISNIEKAKQDKVKIDWKNFPKETEEKRLSPFKWFYKTLEGVLSDFFGKVVIFINSVTEYIKQPDKIEITDYQITEYYGDKKKIYRIKEDDEKIEISYES